MAENEYFEVLGSLTAQYEDLMDSRPWDIVLRRLDFSYNGRNGVLDHGVVDVDSGSLEARFIEASPGEAPPGELYKAYHPRRDVEMLEELVEDRAPGWRVDAYLTSGGVNVVPERYQDRNYVGKASFEEEEIMHEPGIEAFFEDVFQVKPSELAELEEI